MQKRRIMLALGLFVCGFCVAGCAGNGADGETAGGAPAPPPAPNSEQWNKLAPEQKKDLVGPKATVPAAPGTGNR